MDKNKLLDQSYDLYREHCIRCEKWKVAGKDRRAEGVKDFCEKECSIGRKLLEIGDRITYGRATSIAKNLTKDVYMEQSENLSDVEICKKYNISSRALYLRKDHWGLIKRSKTDKCTKENYLWEKSKGFPDWYIAQRLEVSESTLSERKLIWGIVSERGIESIGKNGENISPDHYIKHKEAGKTDKEIRELWGIGRTALQTKKKVWILQREEIGKYFLSPSSRSKKGAINHG